MKAAGPVESGESHVDPTFDPGVRILQGRLAYRLKWYGIGLVLWICFNLMTGLMTGDHSLNDNYFVLVMIAIGVLVKTWVEVEIGRDFVNTYRFGMRTQHIDLYQTRSVRFLRDRLEYLAHDNARYVVKTKFLSLPAIDRLKHHSVPKVGSPPPVRAATPTDVESLPQSHYNLLMFKGGVAILFAVIALLSGRLHSAFHGMPSAVLNPDDPSVFYTMTFVTGLAGVALVLQGAIGSSRQGPDKPDQAEDRESPD